MAQNRAISVYLKIQRLRAEVIHSYIIFFLAEAQGTLRKK